MTHRHVLLVCHDAGGNIPPVIALAQSLVLRGHQVSILSQPSVRQRAVAAGCRFFAFSAIPNYRRDRALEDQLDIAVAVLTGRSAGDDLVSLAQSHGVDLIIVDADVGGGLAAAEALGQPSVVLFHHMYKTFVDTWLADIWPLVSDAINRSRNDYGLGTATGWPDVFAGHDRLLSVVPTEFDAPVDHVPVSMRHFGFLVPHTAPSDRGVGFPPGHGPTVLVGLSTTHHQLHEHLLPTIVDALARLPLRAVVTTAGLWDPQPRHRHPNITITDYIPHASLLEQTDVMLTHAGLGTVAAALTSGVPLVCTPIGRDQPLNAARVTELGAGLTVDPNSSAHDVREAIDEILDNPRYREAAASIAETSRLEGGPTAAVADIEMLLD